MRMSESMSQSMVALGVRLANLGGNGVGRLLVLRIGFVRSEHLRRFPPGDEFAVRHETRHGAAVHTNADGFPALDPIATKEPTNHSLHWHLRDEKAQNH